MQTDSHGLFIVLCNCPGEVASSIARAIVEAKLASCVNIQMGIISVYRWQGEVCEENESTLVIKTTHANLSGLAQLLDEIHPYDVPEIVALHPHAVNASYAQWNRAQVLK